MMEALIQQYPPTNSSSARGLQGLQSTEPDLILQNVPIPCYKTRRVSASTRRVSSFFCWASNSRLTRRVRKLYILEGSKRSFKPVLSHSRPRKQQRHVKEEIFKAKDFLGSKLKRLSGQRVLAVSSDSAAVGYATALLQISQAYDLVDVINTDMEKFSNLLKNRSLYEFLLNPAMEIEKKKSILTCVADEAKFHDYTLCFLNLLLDKKAFGMINKILKEYDVLYNELTNTMVVSVSDAVHLRLLEIRQIVQKTRSLTGADNVKIRGRIRHSSYNAAMVCFG